MTKSLSPTAAAVWEAFEHANCDPYLVDPREAGLAAALRAAADQVVPSDAMEPRNYLPMALECQRIRAELLDIAAELEGNDQQWSDLGALL
jgi:hypothetical protein